MLSATFLVCAIGLAQPVAKAETPSAQVVQSHLQSRYPVKSL
jgi:hypothetical protein